MKERRMVQGLLPMLWDPLCAEQEHNVLPNDDRLNTSHQRQIKSRALRWGARVLDSEGSEGDKANEEFLQRGEVKCGVGIGDPCAEPEPDAAEMSFRIGRPRTFKQRHHLESAISLSGTPRAVFEVNCWRPGTR